MGVRGQCHALAAVYPRGKDSRYPLDRRLGGPRAGLDIDTEARGQTLLSLSGIETRSPDRPVHSQTLYYLRYPGSHQLTGAVYNRLLEEGHVLNF
jgi:hypothetical protein